MKLHSASGVHIGSELATLSGSDPTGSGDYTYTCTPSSSDNCSLSRNTTYYIHLRAPNAPTNANNYYTISTTASTGETRVPSTNGWNFADNGRERHGTTWLTNTHVLRLKVASSPGPSFVASDITATTATLTLTGKGGGWWLKRTTPEGGTCAAGEGDYTHALSSINPGTAYTFKAYGDSACATTALHSVNFTTPAGMTASAVTDTSATLTIAGLSSGTDWWLKETSPNTGTCTAGEADFSHDLSSLNAGTSYTYKAYSDSACSAANELASETFATSASLTASGVSDTGATLTLADATHTAGWSLKETSPNIGTCANQTTATATLTLAESTTYTYQAYSGSGCTAGNEIASETFTTFGLAASGITTTGATLTLTGLSSGTNWWLQESSPSTGTCTAGESDFSHALSSLNAGTSYTYKAYSDNACSAANELASETFATSDALTASAVTTTSATLTLASATHTGNWSVRETAPTTGTCSNKTSATHSVSSRTAGTGYVYKAYSGSGCTAANEIAAVAFTAAVTVSNLSETDSGTALSIGLSGSGNASAQEFTTGTSGYTLKSVTLDFNSVVNAGNITVSLRARATDGTPDFTTTLATLSGTPAFGNSTFTCTTDSNNNCNLEGGTQYFIYVVGSTFVDAILTTTASDAQTQTPASNGWSIADVVRYSGGNWGEHPAGVTMNIKVTALPKPALTASGITTTSATLTLTGETDDWWLKETSPNTGTCTAGESDYSHALSSLNVGTSYTYKAYGDSSCATTALQSVTFTTSATLTASNVTATGATLTLTHATHESNWSLKETAPSTGTCADKTSATHALSSLTGDTSYTYKAYSGSGCTAANEIASETFSTGVSVSTLAGSQSGTQSIGWDSGVKEGAQAFTTGSKSGGYTLTGVTIAFAGKSGNPANLQVHLRSPASGNSSNPDLSSGVSLTGSNPSTGNSWYSCATGCSLSANTTYFITMKAAGAGGYYSATLTGDAEVKAPSTNGWSMADDGRVRSGSTWGNAGSSVAFKMEIEAR